MVKQETLVNKNGERYDYYRGLDEDDRLVHNLVTTGCQAPTGGYFNFAYIKEVKGFSD